MILWANGVMVSPADPVFASTDRGAILGDGLFETIKVRDRRALFLNDHLDRLAASCRVLDLKYDERQVREGVCAVIGDWQGLGALRVTLTRGTGGRGIAPIPLEDQSPSVVVSLARTAPPGDAPIGLHVSSVRRNPWAPSCLHKTLSYADAAFARAEAARAGADDALMLNTMGRAACLSIGNLWMRTNEGFITPPTEDGVLGGIVRRRLLADSRAETTVRPIEPQELTAWPLYRSNSLMGVQPAFLPDGAAPDPDNSLGALYDLIELEEAAR